MATQQGETNIELRIKDVRLSFFKGFRGQPRRNDKTKQIIGWNYSTNFLLDKVKDIDKIKVIRQAMIDVKNAKWPGGKKTFAPDKKCLRDGEVLNDEGELQPFQDGYKGMMYVSANRAVDIDENGKPVGENPVSFVGSRKGEDGKFPRLKEKDGLLYSGAYANVIIRVYALDGKGEYPDRINASLEGVQFLRHGQRFGATPLNPDEKFDDEGPDPDDLDDLDRPPVKRKPAMADLDDI